MSTQSPPRLTECRHGRRGGTGSKHRCCLDWPAPDGLGRYHCTKCGCFTADPDRVHSWCRR